MQSARMYLSRYCLSKVCLFLGILFFKFFPGHFKCSLKCLVLFSSYSYLRSVLIKVLKEGKHTCRSTLIISLLLNQEPAIFAGSSVTRAAEPEEFYFPECLRLL